MKIKFIQVNCREEINTRNWSSPDYRRAQYVLKYKPDIIIFEQPANNHKNPDTIYNKYACKDKPIKLVHEQQDFLRKMSKIHGNGDALSDVLVWNNIMKLWKEGHNVLLYNIDGPTELRREFFEVWKYMYPCATRNWLWWVRIYLREKYMIKNFKWVLEKHKDKEKITIAIFVESFHWTHVKFLLKNSSRKQIWEYYFKRFQDVNIKNISQKISHQNKVFYKYWEKISDFK
jgi:hypothetical protein